MTYALGLTLPGLALGLLVLGVVDVLLFRSRGRRLLGRRGGSPRRVAPVAYDETAAFLTPSKRIELEQRQSQSLMRDTIEDGAPPRTTVDLDAGTAVVRPGNQA